MSEAPKLRNSVRPVHPLVDVTSLFAELDTYLEMRGFPKLTQTQRDEEYPSLQAVANEQFTKLSESDQITDFVIGGEVEHTGLDQGAEPVVQGVLQISARAAKIKAWQVLAKKYLPEA